MNVLHQNDKERATVCYDKHMLRTSCKVNGSMSYYLLYSCVCFKCSSGCLKFIAVISISWNVLMIKLRLTICF